LAIPYIRIVVSCTEENPRRTRFLQHTAKFSILLLIEEVPLVMLCRLHTMAIRFGTRILHSERGVKEDKK
jgi:hypothetical protein